MHLLLFPSLCLTALTSPATLPVPFVKLFLFLTISGELGLQTHATGDIIARKLGSLVENERRHTPSELAEHCVQPYLLVA